MDGRQQTLIWYAQSSQEGSSGDPDGKDRGSESVSRRSRAGRRITRDVVPISVEKRYLACGPHKSVTNAAAKGNTALRWSARAGRLSGRARVIGTAESRGGPAREELGPDAVLVPFLFSFYDFYFKFNHDSSLNLKQNSNVDRNPIFIFIIITVTIIIFIIYLPPHPLSQKGIKDYHNYLSQILYYIYIYL
jgi:hypothetical protein